MKTLVSARSKRFNPWLIAGYAAVGIPTSMLIFGALFGWYTMFTTAPDDVNGWLFAIVCYSFVVGILLIAVLLLTIIFWIIDGGPSDLHRWWRNKVDNYEKIED